MKRLIVVCATCGVGKSTVVENLKGSNLNSDYILMDDVLNWHDYLNKPNEGSYYSDSIDKLVKLSEDKNIIWATCMNPISYKEIKPHIMIDEAKFINLVCSNEILSKRLKGRPVERMTHSDEFIATQIEYMDWFKNNSQLMDLVIDSTNHAINETVEVVLDFIEQF